MSTANTKEGNDPKKAKTPAKRSGKREKPAPKKKSVPKVKPKAKPDPAKPAVKKKPPGRKPGDMRRLQTRPGAREGMENKARQAFDLRCDGWTIRAIAGHLGCSASHVHDCIEKVRTELRAESLDLAAQEREMMLQQIDEAISYVIPHIRGSIAIETVRDGARGPITITVEEYEARMKACSTLSRLVERKARMLGADAPLKVEGLPAAPAAPPEESLAKGRDVLRRWGVSFAPKAIAGATVNE